MSMKKGNFKILALETDTGYITKGNIYEFKNGKAKLDKRESSTYQDFTEFANRNPFFSVMEFIDNNSKIHIMVKDRTTHAILKQGNQVIKRAQAICNPSDEFNFEIGANIAFQRLVGSEVKQEVREVKRHAEVGEFIKIVEVWRPSFNYKKGDVFKVTESNSSTVFTSGKEEHYIADREYVVLENYQPQQGHFDITEVSKEDLVNELRRRLELSGNV
jgi:hypothetical protein